LEPGANLPALSFVVPAYDEERNVPRLVPELVELGRSLGREFEIVCVDDGSRDATAARLASAARGEPRLRFESLARNRGKGAAVKRGLELARGDALLVLDADLSTDLAAARAVLAELDRGADLVLGSRHAPGARIEARQPAARELLGRGFRRLAQLAFAPGVSDFTCGFKGLRRPAAERIAARMTVERWAYDVELVVIARALDLALAEVPVRWRHAPGSKVRILPAVAGSSRDLARVLLRRALGRYR
jgi:glycosyltransferase involved in cell wall biosynthesis